MITRNYIKMCEKDKEIQNNWIPKSGDEFAYTSDNIFSENFGIYLGNIKYSFTGRDKHFIRDIGGITKPSKTFDQDKYIWLPTQEDLQDMIDDYPNVFYNFLNWYSDYALPARKYDSIQELWLAFVMFQNYSKQWSIEKEEWIKL